MLCQTEYIVLFMYVYIKNGIYSVKLIATEISNALRLL
jgi:hypothetical protein